MGRARSSSSFQDGVRAVAACCSTRTRSRSCSRNICDPPVPRGRPVGLIDLLGVDHVLFGSDFPHPEGMCDPLSFVDDLARPAEGGPGQGHGRQPRPPHEGRVEPRSSAPPHRRAVRACPGQNGHSSKAAQRPSLANWITQRSRYFARNRLLVCDIDADHGDVAIQRNDGARHRECLVGPLALRFPHRRDRPETGERFRIRRLPIGRVGREELTQRRGTRRAPRVRSPRATPRRPTASWFRSRTAR